MNRLHIDHEITYNRHIDAEYGARPMNLQAGQQVGAYHILARVGAGGMATVYQAHQPRLDRHVALKVMHATIATDEGFLARFEREARIVAQLDHPNIVPIYDYDSIDNNPYLVMKYINGGTLKQMLRDTPPTLERTAEIIGQIASALTYAHEQGVLHRDIKPSNIIIDMRGIPYITDFGLARIVQAGTSTMSADVMLGTPHYISPEQAQGNLDLDSRTDVYSLGVVLYEMCTGRTPFVGDTSYALIHDQIYTQPPPPRQLNPELSADVEAILLKALAKDRDARYATPQALADDFRRAIRGEEVHIPPRFVQSGNAATDSMVQTPKIKQATPPAPPVPPLPPRGPLGEILHEVHSEVAKGLKEARTEVKKALEEARGEFKNTSFNWRPNASWQQAPDGTTGFYTPEEIEAMEEEILSNLTPEERLRKRIEKRFEERNEFYTHLGIYAVVNSFLWMIWFVTGGGFPWPIFPLGGWGIGVFAHWMDYYYQHGGGRSRREAQIDREMQRELDRMGYKPKNDFADYDNAYLSDEGEIYFEPDEKRKYD